MNQIDLRERRLTTRVHEPQPHKRHGSTRMTEPCSQLVSIEPILLSSLPLRDSFEVYSYLILEELPHLAVFNHVNDDRLTDEGKLYTD